jgi:hypothetical protein
MTSCAVFFEAAFLISPRLGSRFFASICQKRRDVRVG